MNNKRQLLSTAAIDHSLVKKAEENGIELDSLPFIQVDLVNDPELLAETEEICTLAITAVFTSVNAVKAISKLVYITKPDWQIYCIGNATKNVLLDYFHVSAIKGVANSAAELAGIILKDSVSAVVFFCGDRRMDTLPEILKMGHVLVHEMEVYKSIGTPHAVSKQYDGVLFFSPSGADSFFSVNKITSDTVLFAMGDTTAEAIKAWTGNRVIVSEIPSKENLVNQAIQYFNKKAPITVKEFKREDNGRTEK